MKSFQRLFQSMKLNIVRRKEIYTMTNTNMTIAKALELAKQGYEITLRAGKVEEVKKREE